MIICQRHWFACESGSKRLTASVQTVKLSSHWKRPASEGQRGHSPTGRVRGRPSPPGP